MPRFPQIRVVFSFSVLAYATLIMISVAPVQAVTEVLISDNFNGTAGDSINSVNWRVPSPGDGASYGLTTAQTSADALPTTDGNAAILELHTFFPGNTGDPATDRVFGSEIQGRSSFAVGGGLVWEARLRLGSSRDGTTNSSGVPISAPPSGLVGGAFLFDVNNAENTTGAALNRDEADFELLSRQTSSILTNTYNNVGFDGPSAAGNPSLIANPVPGFDPFVYHDYKMEIKPVGSNKEYNWYIDGTLIRTVNSSTLPDDSTIPDQAMTPHFNLWMPNDTFIDAYTSNLSDSSAANNKIHTLSIDNVSLTRKNTTKTLTTAVTNGNFRDDGMATGIGTVSGWDTFNNVNVSDENGGFDDGLALKTFAVGGGFNASGIFQDVTVAAGDVVSLSVYANSPTFDDIVGNGIQFAETWIQFEDSSGDILDRRRGIPLNNGDPNLAQDQWLQVFVEGTAPAGTTHAQIQLAHVGDTLGGAIFWDNVELSILTVDTQDGDFDGDHDVDGGDFLSWQRNFGDEANLDLWEANFGSVQTFATVAVNAVPEPSSVTLLLTIIVSLSVTHRKFNP